MLRKNLLSISVEESTRTRHYWASRVSSKKGLAEQILSSDVLIVPWEYSSRSEDVFPLDTTNFVRRISKSIGADKVTFATEPENYVELALHANHVRWPTIAITTVIFGIFTNMLSDQVNILIDQPIPADTLEMELIVENISGTCISIKYSGPPSRALEMIIREARLCFPKEIDRKVELESLDVSDDEEGIKRK